MDALTVVLQLVFGFLIKKWPALKAWPNRLIPIFNLVLAILIQLAQAATAHAQAGAAPAAHHPGWWAFWQFIQPVLLNTLLSTGIFSTGKNIVQQASGNTP